MYSHRILATSECGFELTMNTTVNRIEAQCDGQLRTMWNGIESVGRVMDNSEQCGKVLKV